MISEGVVAHDLADGPPPGLPLDTSDTRGPVGLTRRIDVMPPSGLEKVMLEVRRAALVAKR